MRGLAIIALTLVCGYVEPARAATFENCTKTEDAHARAALAGAKRLALESAAAVGDTPVYVRWFGKFTPQNGEKVRASLKTVVAAIRTGAVTAQCNKRDDDGCDDDAYAWVYPDVPYRVHLCPSFFDLPQIDGLDPDDPKSENGTQAGTMIHEISHFLVAAETYDHCYSRTECAVMAKHYPAEAIENADSYQYFAEDVAFYAANPDRLRAVLGARISKP